MNQLLEKIKLWFLGIYDTVVDFFKEKWIEQRAICIAMLACILLILLLLVMLPFLNKDKAKASGILETDQYQEVEIEPYLSIPEEPYIEDDYVYTRRQMTRWSDEAVSEWFSEPDEEMLEDLKKANDKLVDDMLEVVP